MDFDNIDPEMFPPEKREMIKTLLEMRAKMLAQLNKAREQNQDNRTKTIGDRVMIWDLSFAEVVEDNLRLNEYVHDAEKRTEQVTTLAKGCVDNPCIVVQENQKYEADFMDHKKTLDLVLWSSKLQKHIRTSSEFVKLID